MVESVEGGGGGGGVYIREDEIPANGKCER